jgi:hypothetical protein
MSDYLLFDLETGPKQDVLDNIATAYEPEVNDTLEVIDPKVLAKTGVDALKSLIEDSNPGLEWLSVMFGEEKIGKNRKGAVEAFEKRIKTLENPLPDKWRVAPETQQIITFGWSKGPDEGVLVDQYEPNEGIYEDWITAGLHRFWDMAHDVKVCGWNITGFDIPILMMESAKRGMYHGHYNIHSFTGVEENMMDLMRVRHGREYKKLRDSALAVGMPVAEDKEDDLMTGANVARAYVAGEYDRIARHCRVDITRLQYLFRAYQGVFFT